MAKTKSKTKLDGKSIYDGPKKRSGLKKEVIYMDPKKKGKTELGNVNAKP